MVLGEIEAGLSLWDRFSRLWRQRPVKEESIADRFLMLLEAMVYIVTRYPVSLVMI
jgi:hypothetical protein